MAVADNHIIILATLVGTGFTGACHGITSNAASPASCHEAKAMVIAKRQVSNKLVVDELNFVVSKIGDEYIVTGTYKEPVPGFEPTVTIDAASCKVLGTLWR